MFGVWRLPLGLCIPVVAALARTQDIQKATELLEVVESSFFETRELQEIIEDMRSVRQTQTELLREARVVFTEQVLLITWKLKGTDTGSSKAKTLVSEQEAMFSQGKDGMQETGLQPCLWKAARTLLG